MSMIGTVFLNEIVEGKGIVKPDHILNNLREKIIHSLGQEGRRNDSKDGMDISVIAINKNKKVLDYAGAFNQVYVVREGELIELKADRMPIGYHQLKDPPFSNQDLSLKANDRIYMFTDGIVDQFGWRNNKKFMIKKFKELLLEIQNVPMRAQKLIFENTFNNWKGDIEQFDDILVMGFQI